MNLTAEGAESEETEKPFNNKVHFNQLQKSTLLKANPCLSNFSLLCDLGG
ncbi:MAG: hypothetical protein ACYSR5_11330 [Planctomycetota bacterium]|jgi:hypothetical protein